MSCFLFTNTLTSLPMLFHFYKSLYHTITNPWVCCGMVFCNDSVMLLDPGCSFKVTNGGHHWVQKLIFWPIEMALGVKQFLYTIFFLAGRCTFWQCPFICPCPCPCPFVTSDCRGSTGNDLFKSFFLCSLTRINSVGLLVMYLHCYHISFTQQLLQMQHDKCNIQV